MGILCIAEAIVMARMPGEPLVGEQTLKPEKRGLAAFDTEEYQKLINEARKSGRRKKDDD